MQKATTWWSYRKRVAADSFSVDAGKRLFPVIMVGGLREYDMVLRIIQNAEADLISMSRPFMREPELIKRWQSGDLRPTECISCNGCMGRFKENQPVECTN